MKVPHIPRFTRNADGDEMLNGPAPGPFYDPNARIENERPIFDFFACRRKLEQRFQLHAEPLTRSFVMTDELGGRHDIARFFEGIEEAAVMRSALIDYHVSKAEAKFETDRDNGR